MTWYPIEPVAKPRMTRQDKWMKRARVLQYRAFQDKCLLYRVTLEDAFRVVFHLPMPSSWSAKKQQRMHLAPHTSRPDLDNLVKGICDAVMSEDSTIWSIQAEKRWSLTPGFEITDIAASALPMAASSSE